MVTRDRENGPMITRPHAPPPSAPDLRSRAGADAERQMASCLRRRFAEDPDVHVLHDLCLHDAEQPDHAGSSGTCRFDHLVIHRWGMFIVVSERVGSEVRVRPDGSDGDESTRVWNGVEKGIPSPIQQARLRGHFLRTYLQRHGLKLLGRRTMAMRTIAKIAAGTDQRGFRNVPIEVVVAVSDPGWIRRLDGWTAPEEPFRVFATKADLVPDKVAHELTRHRKGASRLGNPATRGTCAPWSMTRDEAAAVATFLAERRRGVRPHDSPGPERRRRAPPARPPGDRHATATSDDPTCKHCASKDLVARWGRYGYYWQCRTCEENTPMPTVCRACGANGHQGGKVRIRNDGPTYFRDCERCGHSEQVWTVT